VRTWENNIKLNLQKNRMGVGLDWPMLWTSGRHLWRR